MIKSFLCDMDGVIYKGKQLIPGAKEFIERLQKSKCNFLFLTNNSEQTAKDLLLRLIERGINGLTENNFITAGMATAIFLNQQANEKTAYLIGGTGLFTELINVNFKITTEKPEYVVIGKTKDFNYEMLKTAVALIRGGSRFIATNPDVLDPTEEGIEPACGSLIAAIEKASGKKPYVIGKPNALMMTIAKRKLLAHATETMMIGDRMDTDIVGGLEAGMKTCLVLSGVSSRKTIEKYPYKPDYIHESVAEIYPENFA
jgi:NagD protein